jgi:inner membrane protein
VDSITHIALGAVMGEAIAGKSLGKRAMFIGAIAQSIPDFDFIASFWLPATDDLLAHRGITHSFLFGIVTTVALALLSQRWYRNHKIPLSTWIFFYGIEILVHLLLDACNAYGIGWFEPFNHQRLSFHILFVADPFFSLWPGIALAALMTLDSKNTFRRFWIYFGLCLSGVYFLYAVSNKISINNATKKSLRDQRISFKRYFSTPTPLNTWLWYIVAESDSGYYITYRSTFNDQPLSDITYFPRKGYLLEPLKESDDVKKLLRFSQGYYTVQQWGDTLVFNDLRFGQIAGWGNPAGKFVFHYYLNYPDANLLVIQRGRFSNWNSKTFSSMIKRIRGK